MKKLVTLFFALLFTSAIFAQSLEITQSLQMIKHSSVMVQYYNQFGKHNMPDMDDPFPFAVIVMQLEGNAAAVKAAKEVLQLDLGTQKVVTDQYRDKPNEIQFLIENTVKNVYVTCGEGCSKQLLATGIRFKSNTVYVCKVKYTPAEGAIQASQAETNKKSNIVVMDIVDKTQQVPEAFKQIILSNFNKYILETSLYDVKEVSRISNLINGNEYRATGNLSPDQINAINKSEVDYLLLTEINFANAKKQIEDKNLEKFVEFFNADDYIVNVKVLNTKTNMVEKSDYFISKNNRSPMQTKSMELAGRLFQPQAKDVVADEQVEEKQEIQEAEPIKIIRYSKSDRKIYGVPEYKYGETAMDREAMTAFLKRNCPEAYKKMAKSKGVIAGGWSCFAIGLAALAGGAAMEMLYVNGKNNRFNDWKYISGGGYYRSPETNGYEYLYIVSEGNYYKYKVGEHTGGPISVTRDYPFEQKYSKLHIPGVALVSAGATLFTVSIPVLGAGYGMRNNAYKKFNKKCATSTPLTLNVQAGSNGLGFSLDF